MSDHISTTDSYRPHERIDDLARRHREELAKLTFAHDYGFPATKLAMDTLGHNAFYAAVGAQRAEMRLDGRIIMDETGNERRVEKLNLAKLGLSADVQAQVQQLAAEALTEPSLGSHTARAVATKGTGFNGIAAG